MVADKHIEKIILALMAAAVVLCLLAAAFSDQLTEALGGTGVTMEYESKLFNTDEIISIDIQMDEDAWNDMLDNALAEEYYVCDVVINGKTIRNVAIRPKGNTSLSAIASDPDSDRYSLKIEFGHFVEGQTCWGLDKLILNNNYADATNMKEAIIYDMYQYIGTDASLYNYAEVSVNGEYWGVYLALEAVEDSFMLRNFGTQDGELYKPDSLEMGGNSDDSKSSDQSRPESGFPGGGGPSQGGFPGGGGGFNFDPSSMPDMGDRPENMPDMGDFDPDNMPEGFDPENIPDMSNFSPDSMPDMSNFNPDSMPDMSESGKSGKGGFSGGGFSRGGGGADLNYTDDDPDSYSTIWEGSVTKTGDADHKRVVTALKNISEGNDLETYLDVDNILKYMAVHTFSVNMDSLSGSMSHNYYLYEYDGQLNLFPWDYNLSLGGMSMGNSSSATDMVNDAIDTPFSGTDFFDALLENEEYLEQYHAYLQQLVDEYVNGGRFDEVYSRIRSQIDSLVETDPTAFYGYDEYETAAEMLYETVKLRAASIEGQLDGTIPSTDEGQRQNPSSLIDASHIDVKAMGQFSMGGFGGGFGGKSEDSGGSDPANMPEGFDPENMPEDADSEKRPGAGSFSFGSRPSSGGFGPGSFKPGDSTEELNKKKLKNLATYGICLALALAGLAAAAVYKRSR